MEMLRCYYKGGAFAAIRAESLWHSVLISSHWARAEASEFPVDLKLLLLQAFLQPFSLPISPASS